MSGGGALRRVLCLDDFEPLARRRLPGSVFAYINGAAERNASLLDNTRAFEELAFVPHYLRDVSRVNTQVTLWDETYDAPFGIAPMGLSALAAYRGDCVLAQAASDRNIPMIMSGSSLIRLEEVARVAPRSWFQAYLPGQEDQILALLARVEQAGFRTLVITVDSPIAANRENNVRAGFSTPLRPSLRLMADGVLHARWTLGTFGRTVLRHGLPHFENNYATRGAPILSRNVLRDFSDRGHLNWSHLALIRRTWRGRLVVKGLLSVDDARQARDHGADGIIVSNHGGRQLDGNIAPLRVLREIVQACSDVPVMMDSGVRRGSDALKALALGARLVFVGRPFLYAATVAGHAGVTHAIGLMHDEVRRNLAMLGITEPGLLSPAQLRAVAPMGVDTLTGSAGAPRA